METNKSQDPVSSSPPKGPGTTEIISFNLAKHQTSTITPQKSLHHSTHSLTQFPSDDYALSSMIKKFKNRNFRYRMNNWKNDINHKNQILMNKLMAISMERPHYKVERPKKLVSLNVGTREREQKRIIRENLALAKRMYHKRPFIDK